MLRCTVLLLFAANAPVPALAQQAPRMPPGAVANGPEVVVTAVPLKDAQAALAACLAQHCPPDKDIEATLAVAELQFVAGDYKDARGVMLKSIARNHRFAKTYPVAVSDVLRANSRVAAHLGETDAYHSGALDVVSALKAGLPETDERVLGAQIELADSFAKTGRPEAAVELYRRVAKRAHASGHPRAEGYALLRLRVRSPIPRIEFVDLSRDPARPGS